jgi:hypothetical protein
VTEEAGIELGRETIVLTLIDSSQAIEIWSPDCDTPVMLLTNNLNLTKELQINLHKF